MQARSSRGSFHSLTHFVRTRSHWVTFQFSAVNLPFPVLEWQEHDLPCSLVACRVSRLSQQVAASEPGPRTSIVELLNSDFHNECLILTRSSMILCTVGVIDPLFEVVMKK